MRIGVIGPGKVGSGLGEMWVGAGHEVMLSFGRDEERLAKRADAIGGSAGTPAEAAAFGDAVLLAAPWAAVEEALSAGGSLDGKILIDATNNFDPDLEGSGAARVARLAPGASVVKAFNTAFAASYSEVRDAERRPDLIFCGDDGRAKQVTAELIRAAGFEPVDAGSLAVAENLEAFARLVIGIAYEQGRGPFAYWLRKPSDIDG